MIVNEEFFLEYPSISRKLDAINYYNEFVLNNSHSNGDGGLDKFLDRNDYEGWLLSLENKKNGNTKDNIYSETYFFIRKSDNRLIGMVDLRFNLNEYLERFGGHVGYAIRPSERLKGYNKINAYLALNKFLEHGLETILVTCSDDNVGSRKTVESFESEFLRCELDPSDNEMTNIFSMNVIKSIEKFKRRER